MKYKILSIGTTYLDINCHNFPYDKGLFPEQETVGEKYEIAPGGSALNFARVCASINLEPIFIGKVGKDKISALLTEILSETGITTDFIHSPDVTTNIGINFIGEDEKSIMSVVGSANQSLQGEEIENQIEKHIKDIEYLYLGGCFKLKSLMASYEKIAKKAKHHKVKIILDHGRVTKKVSLDEIQIIKKLLPFVDYYFPSKDELLTTWDVTNIEEAVHKIREVSSSVIVVKDAENGAVGFSGKESFNAPSFSVKVINTVGAGDSFNAGFIKAQDLKLDFKESLRFACATAALKISQTDLPTTDKIKALMKIKA